MAESNYSEQKMKKISEPIKIGGDFAFNREGCKIWRRNEKGVELAIEKIKKLRLKHFTKTANLTQKREFQFIRN